MEAQIKWLNHEDLINNGWKYHEIIDTEPGKDYSDFFYTKHGYQLRYAHRVTGDYLNYKTYEVKISIFTHFGNAEVVFNGTCNTIEDLNYIFKLVDETQ